MTETLRDDDYESRLAAGVAAVIAEYKRRYPNVITVEADHWTTRYPRRRRPPRRGPGRVIPLVRPKRRLLT